MSQHNQTQKITGTGSAEAWFTAIEGAKHGDVSGQSHCQSDFASLKRRAYRLYVRYQTSTYEYRQIAESLGLTGSGELNSLMCDIYNARLRARTARRFARRAA